MASGEYNEIYSQLSSSNDNYISKKHLNEHEETIKSDQMAKKLLSNDEEVQIADLNDNDLKSLLDEAMTYKNPRDVNDKSETFKRLLQNVTEEDEKRKFESNSLHWKAQSNSLQNLLDDSHYQLQNHQSQISSKKHQQRRKNSTSVSTRRLEGGSLPVDMHHSSAVQSPPDQPFLSEYKNKKRKEKQQTKDTVIDMVDMETDDRKTFLKCFESNKDTSSYHDGDGIEMKSFANRIEMDQVQDQSSSSSSSSKFTTANNTPNTITTMASLISTGSPITTSMISKDSRTSLTNSVDSIIQFPIEKPKLYQQAQVMDQHTVYAGSTINHNNNIVLTGGSSNYGASSSGSKLTGVEQPLQLSTGMGVNSVMDTKSYPYSNKFKGQGRDDVGSLIQTSSSSSILPTSHPSSNSSSSKEAKANKKRTAKSERNEKKIEIEKIQGYRGGDTLESLLNYIDGQHNNDGKSQKNHPKNGIVSNQTNEQLLNAEDKKKKMVAKNKEKMNKLKKSNSMDELCSTGRQQEKSAAAAAETDVDSVTANKIVHDVTLRSKSSNLTSAGAKKSDNRAEKIQSKRNERRSWGTEGLWPESSSNATNDLMTTRDNQFEQQENETSSSCSSSGVQLDFTATTSSSAIADNAVNNLPNIESISTSSEADKFQVVIKKRKVKRKSNEAPEPKTTSSSSNVIRRDGGGGGGGGNNNNNIRSGTKTYNENSRNDSSIKNVKNTKPMNQDAKHSASKSRRKSTSSMPPSDGEEGEYSDGGDSVQSLPIETTKTTSSLLTASSNNTSAENSGKINNKKSSNPATTQQISPSTNQQQQQQQQQQKPTTFSYADIAKTNTRTNNNNVIAASTEKWPSISSSSSSSTHQNSNTNNDPFAISNFDAINNNTNHNSNNNNNNNNAVKQKSTPVTTTTSSSSLISTSTMSFPDLVESNNNRNKQLNINPLEMTAAPATAASNGDATQTEKSLNGLERAFDSNNNNNNNNNSVTSNASNNNSNSDDRIKISYSQSLLEKNNYQDIDTNGNNNTTNLPQPPPPPNGNVSISSSTSLATTTNAAAVATASSITKNILTKSKSVDHNNLSSIEHYPALEKTKQTLSDVLSKPMESLSSKTKSIMTNSTAIVATTPVIIAPVVLPPMPPQQLAANGKRAKKDKLALKKSTSNVSTSTYSTQQSNIHHPQQQQQQQQQHSHHRPAVIILNDDCDKSNDLELGITFGFDINEHLLFGHHNGDVDAVVAAEIDPSVEMNTNINNNNNNCDIMNTNNLSSNNINNLTNQSCGFEIYENFIASPQQQHQMIHSNAIIQSSSPNINIKDNAILDSSNQSSSIDLGYMSSSILTNSTTSPANQNIMSNEMPPPPQPQNNDNQYEKDHIIMNTTSTTTTPMDIKQHIKFEELISRFVTPEPAKNFNYDELVTFVSEEWTKVMRNGVLFNE